MNFTFLQIFIESIIISSLIIFALSYFSYRSTKKSPSSIQFEKNNIFLLDCENSKEFVFEISRFREMTKETVWLLKFLSVIVVVLWIFLIFNDLIFNFLKINIISQFMEIFKDISSIVSFFFSNSEEIRKKTLIERMTS